MTIQATSRATAEHYRWGDGCDGWHLVKNTELGVIQETMPPGTSEAGHFHQRAQQFFFVLAREAVMDIEGGVVRLAAKEAIHIPAGIAHQIRNESAEPLEFLVISQPHSHGDRQQR